MRKTIVSCIYFSIAVIAACTSGSGAGGSAGAITTSVNTSTPVNQLSTAQLQQWCNDLEAYESANKSADQNIACLSRGQEAGRLQTGSDGVTACENAYTTCESGGDAGSDGITVTTSAQDCSTVTTAQVAACGVTVAAFDQCIQDNYSSEESLSVTTVCSELSSTGSSDPLNVATPPSCVPVFEQCVTTSSSTTTTTTGNGG